MTIDFAALARELMPDCGCCKGTGTCSDGRCSNCDALGVIVLTRSELAEQLRAVAEQAAAEERERLFEIREEAHCLHSDCTVPSKFWLQLTEAAFNEMGPFESEDEAERARSKGNQDSEQPAQDATEKTK